MNGPGLNAATQGLRNNRILFERMIRALEERPAESAASHIIRWARASIEDTDELLAALAAPSTPEPKVMGYPERTWHDPRFAAPSTEPALNAVYEALAKEHALLRGPSHASPNGWYANGKYDNCVTCNLLRARLAESQP